MAAKCEHEIAGDDAGVCRRSRGLVRSRGGDWRLVWRAAVNTGADPDTDAALALVAAPRRAEHVCTCGRRDDPPQRRPRVCVQAELCTELRQRLIAASRISRNAGAVDRGA